MRYISIIILLVLYLTLLLLTGCVVNTVIPETTMGNLGNQENTEEPIIENTEEPIIENTEEPVMWSGLGMGMDSQYIDLEDFGSQVDTLIANGFTELRIDMPDYQDINWLNHSKEVVIDTIAKGIQVIWGVSSNSFNNSNYAITTENWATFRQAILDAAQWAQANGVYEFQLGNEEECHVGVGMTETQLITNLKSVAIEVQAIFTNGKVSYTCGANFIDDWISGGKGDLDILATNIYSNQGDWETRITNLINAFGSAGTYLTEFSLNATSLNAYSTDEAVQAAAVTEMIEYIKSSGIERAFFFTYWNNTHGVVKVDGSYRLLWSQALLNA